MFSWWKVICIEPQSVFLGQQKCSHYRYILVYGVSILGRLYVYLTTFSLAQVKEHWMIKQSVNMDWKGYEKERSWSKDLNLGPLKHKARMLPTGQRCLVCLDRPYFISQSIWRCNLWCRAAAALYSNTPWSSLQVAHLHANPHHPTQWLWRS